LDTSEQTYQFGIESSGEIAWPRILSAFPLRLTSFPREKLRFPGGYNCFWPEASGMFLALEIIVVKTNAALILALSITQKVYIMRTALNARKTADPIRPRPDIPSVRRCLELTEENFTIVFGVFSMNADESFVQDPISGFALM
jgi:hypothetical protein